MKRILHTFYGVGAAVVLVGALCEIGDINYGSIKGLEILKAGLAIEAVVFLVSAFDYSDIKKGKKSGYRWTIRKEIDETQS